jgi:hypothetical protein
MARISSLRGWVSIIAAVSLVLTASALIIALATAANARASSRELSQRLVPAAAAAGVLLSQYTAQQTALRDYVTGGRAATLAAFTQSTAQIPGEQTRLAALVRGYPRMDGQLAAAESAHNAWLARVAGPQLAAAARGDFTRARVLQANTTASRPYTLAVRTRMAALQAQITDLQAQVTGRLIGAQGDLLAALAGVCVVVAVIAAGGVVVVRRWLLAPFTAVRRAAEAVAAGRYHTPVPAVGPAELADLGRAAELMRTRLVAALDDAELAEGKFRGLFESSPDATLTVTADGSIVMVNAQAERMFGYSAGELAGQPVDRLIPTAAGKAEDYLAALGPQPIAGITVTATGKDGQEFPAEITVNSLPTESGMAAAVSIRDITERLAAQAEHERLRGEAERNRYEARLAQSQRLESLGQLVGGIAHDFNNLLNVIAGYTEFIAEQVTSLAGQNKQLQAVLADVEEVRGAASRAASLTRQLLIFARRDVIHPQVLDVGTIVSGVENLLRRTLGEHIDLDTSHAAAGLWPVKADPGQIEQVLINLAVNARDAMPGGGKLTIDTSNITVDETYASTRPDLKPGRYTRLRVSDTGTGMDHDTLARVFEPFFSTKPTGSGTGLGLATVYGIITHAGGHAQIYSEPGLGTTVTALLPATDAAPSAAAEPVAAAPAAGRGETVLLVEDEHSLWQLASRILIRSGYQVCPAATPAEALRQASDLDQPISLLLTDVVMPEMLGNELAALVRAIRPDLPVLFMSGYAQQVLDAQGALDVGVDLLEKPFSQATMLTRVRQAIDNGGQPAAPAAAAPAPVPAGRAASGPRV